MASGKDNKGQSPRSGNDVKTALSPAWADGLRQLYDAVVEEPIPDSFKELLSQLDSDAEVSSTDNEPRPS